MFREPAVNTEEVEVVFTWQLPYDLSVLIVPETYCTAAEE